MDDIIPHFNIFFMHIIRVPSCSFSSIFFRSSFDLDGACRSLADPSLAWQSGTWADWRSPFVGLVTAIRENLSASILLVTGTDAALEIGRVSSVRYLTPLLCGIFPGWKKLVFFFLYPFIVSVAITACKLQKVASFTQFYNMEKPSLLGSKDLQQLFNLIGSLL